MVELLHGDCLELMKDIPDKSIDMILCDLPYGTTACKWDVIIPFEPLWIEYKRIIKDRGCIALFGSEPFSSYLRMSNIKKYKYDWIWNKVKPGGIGYAKFQPMRKHELISIFSNEYPFRWFPIKTKREKPVTVKNYQKEDSFHGKYRNNTKTYTYTHKNPDTIIHGLWEANAGKLHPTQKPVALLEYLIKTYTLEGETVLDNCMGSFSTAIACLNTKRSFIGIEKDAHYFQVGKDRVEKHLLTLDYNPEIVYYQV